MGNLNGTIEVIKSHKFINCGDFQEMLNFTIPWIKKLPGILLEMRFNNIYKYNLMKEIEKMRMKSTKTMMRHQ